jgi:dihydroflavonol-4-reductase
LPQLWAKPRNRFHEVNYQGAVQVLDEAVRAGCARILHVSSATVWPLPGALQCRTADAIGPYCRAKLHAERHALKLARQGAPIVVVSPTLPLGPGDLSRTPPTQLLLDFCRGWRREYLDINLNVIDARDAADAIVRALQAGTPRERYLLGHTTLPLLELYHRLAALTGLAVPRWRVPYSVALTAGIIGEWWSEVVSGVAPVACVAGVRLACRPLPADPAADLRRLGIVPRPLEQTLSETVRWFREVGWLA